MLKRATLQVLSELAEIGLPEALDVQTSAFDPLLRPLLRKRVAKAVAVAEARCVGMGIEHVLCVAFVLEHPEVADGLDVRDEKAVREVYRTLSAPYTGIPADQALRPGPGAYRVASDPNAGPPPSFRVLPRKKRRWPVTTPLIAAGVVSALGVAFAFAAPYILPTREDRFRSTAFGMALDEPLTAYVAQVGHDEAPVAGARIVTNAVKRQIGPAAFEALSRAVDGVPVARESNAGTTDEAVAPLLSAINDLDRALALRKIPAAVLAYARTFDDEHGIKHRSVWLTSYYVERRTVLSFQGWSGRTAWGRRIDGLNLTDDPVYKSVAEDWALLSLDRVEEELVGIVLASMATGAPLGPHYDDHEGASLGADEEAGEIPRHRADVARALGPILAEDVEQCSGVTAQDAARIAAALKARNDAALELRSQSIASDRLRISTWVRRDLERQGSWSPLVRDLLRTNDRLTVYGRSFQPAVEGLARLEEEELMGRIFYAQLAVTPTPALEKLTPDERAVISAELSLLAQPQPCPRLALWRVLRMTFDPRSRVEYESALPLFDALLHELGIPAPSGAGRAEGAAILDVMRTAPAEVEAAARRAHEALVGRPPTIFTRLEAR